MVYSYTPAYYSTLHDSITSLCKTILPFSLKKSRLPAPEQRLSKLQSDNLKWQQDSFHQILNLMGLHKEGILDETQLSTFRTHLLDTLIASQPDHENEPILRDKLVFLQELLYAKCISEEEYHSSKRPLLQRLAVQGGEMKARDVTIMANPKQQQLKKQEQEEDEEWSVIDLKDEKQSSCLLSKEKSRTRSAKSFKGAASVFGFGSGSGSSHKTPSKKKAEKCVFKFQSAEQDSKVLVSSRENPFWEANSILMQQETTKGINGKTTPIPTPKKQWGFDGIKKWKRNDQVTTPPLPLNERSDNDIKTLQNANNAQTQATNPAMTFGENKNNNSNGWKTFDDEENYHPNSNNLFASSISAGAKDHNNRLYENPFWNV